MTKQHDLHGKPPSTAPTCSILIRRFAFLALALLLGMDSAAGGMISFDIRATDQVLAITHIGDSAAYAPSVFALGSSGEWVPLPVAGKSIFQWNPRETLDFTPYHPSDAVQPLDSLRVLMICFFDQNGVEFGQLAFLNPPPRADNLVDARYQSGKLTIHAPDKKLPIAVTWVLWPREPGISPIAYPLKLTHAPPRPLTIRWKDSGLKVLAIDTGRRFPAVYLVHQIVTGNESHLVLQSVSAGMKNEEQRAGWLNQGPMFYGIGAALLAAGFVFLIPAITARGRRGHVDG